jgi:membrane protein YqaA with SNARE-associated domain
MQTVPVAIALGRTLVQFGGPGLIVIGIIDNSFIPFPGLQDISTALLAMADEEWWFYYAIMSTLGATLGGYLTFRMGRKGGEEALEKRLSESKVQMVRRRFRSWGWGAVFLPAVLPPPFPAVPFFFAAGVLDYPVRGFLLALAAGRFLRYLVLALLAARYGRTVLHLLSDRTALTWVSVIIVLVFSLGVVSWLLIRRRYRKG